MHKYLTISAGHYESIYRQYIEGFVCCYLFVQIFQLVNFTVILNYCKLIAFEMSGDLKLMPSYTFVLFESSFEGVLYSYYYLHMLYFQLDRVLICVKCQMNLYC